MRGIILRYNKHYMISTLFRFRGHNSLRYVYANGKAVRSQLFTIKYTANKRRTHPRFSVVVSKKVIKSAVARNRIRRRVYEYVRQAIETMPDVYDVVIICTSAEVRTLPYEQIKKQLDDLFIKAELSR